MESGNPPEGVADRRAVTLRSENESLSLMAMLRMTSHPLTDGDRQHFHDALSRIIDRLPSARANLVLVTLPEEVLLDGLSEEASAYASLRVVVPATLVTGEQRSPSPRQARLRLSADQQIAVRLLIFCIVLYVLVRFAAAQADLPEHAQAEINAFLNDLGIVIAVGAAVWPRRKPPDK
jgi:hypothetical protein